METKDQQESEDNIAKARKALAALVAAKDACDAANITSKITVFDRTESVLDVLAIAARERIESEERRAQPLSFGDVVKVLVPYSGKHEFIGVVSVGPKNIMLEGNDRYRLSDGVGREGYARIREEDLFRIKRDLVGKRPPRATSKKIEAGR